MAQARRVLLGLRGLCDVGFRRPQRRITPPQALTTPHRPSFRLRVLKDRPRCHLINSNNRDQIAYQTLIMALMLLTCLIHLHLHQLG